MANDRPVGFGQALHGGLFGVFAAFDQLGFLCFHQSTAFPLLVVAFLGHLDQFLALKRGEFLIRERTVVLAETFGINLQIAASTQRI
jgi:hypothetical protein